MNAKGTSWLKNHLNEFVLPQIGYIPTDSLYPKQFSREEMSVIKNIWKSIKKESQTTGKLLILPGRDVFIFEILARRENFPTLFIPACSRTSVEYFKDKIPDNSIVFDTGFMGTIPQKLGIDNFKLCSYNIRQSKVQVFPHLTLSRSLALHIEKTPKYWKTGQIFERSIRQDFSEKEEFIKAAVLTQQIYKDSSPSFINNPKPLGDLTWRIKI